MMNGEKCSEKRVEQERPVNNSIDYSKPRRAQCERTEWNGTEPYKTAQRQNKRKQGTAVGLKKASAGRTSWVRPGVN